MESASSWSVILYDTGLQRAALIDGASALLHVGRTWFIKHKERLKILAKANNMADEDLKRLLEADQKFWYPRERLGRESALQSLYEYGNRSLPTYEKKGLDGRDGRWESVAEQVHEAFRKIHDHLVHVDMNPTQLRSESDKLEGYDLTDIASGQLTLEPRTWSLEKTSGLWPEWSVQSHMITLFGSDLGDIVKPDPLTKCMHGHDVPICCTGRDYLVAPMQILRQTSNHFRTKLSGCATLGASIFWENPLASFRNCCGTNGPRLTVSKLVSKPIIAPRPPQECVLLNGPEFTDYEYGAVVFGSCPKPAVLDRFLPASDTSHGNSSQSASSENDSAVDVRSPKPSSLEKHRSRIPRFRLQFKPREVRPSEG